MFSLNSDISGTDITDNIAMQADGKQIEAIEMLMLNKVTGNLSNMGEDGVIGFTPRRMRDLGKGNKFDSLTEKRHSPFLTQIYKKQLIQKKMFAMHSQDNESMLWLGGYPPKEYLETNFPTKFTNAQTLKDYREQFNWINMKKGAKDWTTKINKFTINESKYDAAQSDLQFDSGKIFSYIPKKQWKYLEKAIRANIDSTCQWVTNK